MAIENSLSESKHLYLIKGDLSGIQGFIFNVKSKGAAKAVKGRSFFLKLVIQLAMEKILSLVGLTGPEAEAAKISTSGGAFILRVPLSDPALIEKVQLELTTSLQYTGLNLVLSYVPSEANYTSEILVLNQQNRKKKYQLYSSSEAFFQVFDRSLQNQANKNDTWSKIADAIKKDANTHYVILQDPEKNNGLRITGKSVSLAGFQVIFGGGEALGNKAIALDTMLEHIFPANKTFEHLVTDKILDRKGGFRKAKGLNKLGVLVMDVDNLGPALQAVQSWEEYAKFDQDLRSFFNENLKRILAKDPFKDKVYVITAGGDDSFFVGRWNYMLDLALRIQQAFQHSFGEKGLTISAGLSIVHEKFPVVRFTEIGEEAIKRAKRGEKGNLSILGEVVSWKVMESQIMPLRKKLGFNRELISKGLLAKARQKALTSLDPKEGIHLSDYWKMSYYLRNTDQRDIATVMNFLDRSIEKAGDPSLSKIERQSYRIAFPLAARLAEFDNRKG
ncbi:MAG: hypothetical protein AAFR61_15335 [Bacteroidota bacterium]